MTIPAHRRPLAQRCQKETAYDVNKGSLGIGNELGSLFWKGVRPPSVEMRGQPCKELGEQCLQQREMQGEPRRARVVPSGHREGVLVMTQ